MAVAARSVPAQKAAVVLPRNIPPVVHPALAGEGVWSPAGRTVGRTSPIYTTVLRPDPTHPTVVAGLAWIDTSKTRLVLVPGLKEPMSSLPPGSGKVPPKDLGRLLATFNSGFKTKDGNGGFVSRGRVYVPPKPGLVTLAVYRGGRVKLGSWGKEVKPSPKLTYLRQNLPLILDHGRVSPTARKSQPWVAGTVSNNILLWRSGIGIDRRGNLLYAASGGVSEAGLAKVLRRAGAVRAMALDENTVWPDFFTYGAPGENLPIKLLPGMANGLNRYLVPDQRDFFMVLARTSSGR